MKTYLLSAAGVIFLSVIVTLLVPEGKLHKTVTFVMRLICIFVLIRPLATVFDFGSDGAQTAIADYGYVAQVYSSHQSAQLEILLKEKYGDITECAVSVEYDGEEFVVKSVIVSVPDSGSEIIENIYAYLEELGYINITVYATCG